MTDLEEDFLPNSASNFQFQTTSINCLTVISIHTSYLGGCKEEDQLSLVTKTCNYYFGCHEILFPTQEMTCWEKKCAEIIKLARLNYHFVKAKLN